MGRFIRSLRLLVAAVFASILMGPAMAQDLSAESLREIYDDCMVGCVAAQNGQICETLCRCASTEVGSRMSESRYAAFKANMDNQNVSPEDAALMEEIGGFCAGEAGL